ncbi:DUF2970 domain-containing protein [Pseudohongiella spirulinae]|uniref:DUF2970 domain-containing protein n=1 Tax=Pseudohongiella spirulinae TaxID=1249552 RepID=A0A0S2KD62_9GAMM|nr:DUF2970 domain-containing protein [Pseudohongiella spirulinae]ALO46117.1 hypothetical protein PS2015_1460 [Pseudohongiella spirulinae]
MTEHQNQPDQKQSQEPQKENRKLSFWQTMGSVIAASFGVQSQKNKERDFEKGSISGFIAAALIFTVVFVVTLVVIVRLVLP